MSGILSAISGQFSKLIILGTFLPTAIFVSLSFVLVVPLIPTDWAFVKQLEVLDTQQVIVISLVTIGLSAVLYNLNIPIIRLYEGYPWQNSTLGRQRVRHYQQVLAAANARRAGMRTLLRKLGNPDDDDYKQILGGWVSLGEKLNSDLPNGKALILPTRLGNAIRSFEYYPNHQYGIDAVALWPRLIPKIDKDYAAEMADAKTSFDFMLNNSLLFTLLALAVLIVGLFYPNHLISDDGTDWTAIGSWIVTIALLFAVAYLFYSQSIGRAIAWGSTVKSAFDLYRWDLLKALGYEQVPETREAEQTLWSEISRRVIYGKHPTLPESPYHPPAPPLTYVSCESKEFVFEITRGVKSIDMSGTLTTVLHLRRIDESKKEISKVVVIDTLSQGFDYEFGSVEPGSVKVSGINPLRFEVKTMTGREMDVTYRVIKLEALSQRCLGQVSPQCLPAHLAAKGAPKTPFPRSCKK